MFACIHHYGSACLPELSPKTKENLAQAVKIALVVGIALGFLTAAIFSGGAAVAAATIGGAAIYGTLCGVSCIGVIAAEITAECQHIFDKSKTAEDVAYYVLSAIFFPLIALCYTAPVLIQGAAITSARR